MTHSRWNSAPWHCWFKEYVNSFIHFYILYDPVSSRQTETGSTQSHSQQQTIYRHWWTSNCLYTVGRNWKIHNKPTHAQGEHANFTPNYSTSDSHHIHKCWRRVELEEISERTTGREVPWPWKHTFNERLGDHEVDASPGAAEEDECRGDGLWWGRSSYSCGYKQIVDNTCGCREA